MILFFLKFSFIEQKEKKIILHDMLSIKGAVARSPKPHSLLKAMYWCRNAAFLLSNYPLVSVFNII